MFGITAPPMFHRRNDELAAPPFAFPELFYDIRPEFAVIDGSNRAVLLADRSGKSEMNCLCLNGAANNNASLVDAPSLDLGTAFQFDFDLAASDWTPSANQSILGRWNATANKRSYQWRIATDGTLVFQISTDGTSGTIASWVSTQATGIADLARKKIRFVRNGTLGQYFISDDGSTWTQLGTDITGASAAAPFATDLGLVIGGLESTSDIFSGKIFSVVGYSDAGVIEFLRADFSTASKLATSFVCATGQTVTINSTGDLGARICGARDAVQFTSGKMAVYTAPASGNPGYIATDGGNDYHRAAAFPLAQPLVSVSAVRQLTWTSGDYLFDGASAANSAGLIQTTTTPQLNINAGSSVAANTGLPVDTDGVLTGAFNGAGSSLRVGRGTATAGNAGAASPNGITIGANGASTAASFGHMRLALLLIYQGSQYDAIAQDRLARWAMYRNRIAA